jgi:hypothetical protein
MIMRRPYNANPPPAPYPIAPEPHGGAGCPIGKGIVVIGGVGDPRGVKARGVAAGGVGIGGEGGSGCGGGGGLSNLIATGNYSVDCSIKEAFREKDYCSVVNQVRL